MTLSPQLKIIGLAAAVLAIGMLGLMLLGAGRRRTASAYVPPVVHHKVTARHLSRSQPMVAVDLGLPAPLRQALARSPLVVAVLYAPNAPGDTAVVQAARSGAAAAHAGFAALNVRNEAVAMAVATKLPGSSDPSVLVVRRPGTIAVVLGGYPDAAIVAQAASGARG